MDLESMEENHTKKTILGYLNVSLWLLSPATSI